MQFNIRFGVAPAQPRASQGKLEQRLQLEERVMLAEQERQYEQAFDAMLAAQHAQVCCQLAVTLA